MTNARVLICKAERGVVVVPIDAEPAPVHHHSAAALAEVRDVEVATWAPNYRLPAEDGFALEVLLKEDDASLLNFLQVAQSETGLRRAD